MTSSGKLRYQAKSRGDKFFNLIADIINGGLLEDRELAAKENEIRNTKHEMGLIESTTNFRCLRIR